MAGPVAYRAGAAFDALAITSGSSGYATLAAVWAVATLLFAQGIERIDASAPAEG